MTMTKDEEISVPSSPSNASSDPMQSIMEEAQQLIEALGVDNNESSEQESIVIDGFAIDSDDDDEEDEQGDVTTELPSKEEEEEEPPPPRNGNIPLHPLHQDVIGVVLPTSTTTTTPAITTPTTSTSPRSKSTQQQQQQHTAVAPVPVTSPSTSLSSSFDFKAKTSQLASNFVTMAQKAASQVQDKVAAATVPPQPPHTIQQALSMQEQTSIVAVEMNNEQKAALIQKHVGTLLPGERVIMFLSPLLHVSDSTTEGGGGGGELLGTNWCCAMTYYRILLFDTTTKVQQDRERIIPSEWNPHCWTLPEFPSLLQIPLASMDRVDKSIYTTPSNHTMMGLVIYGKDNGRYLKFTTPSYADMLRAHEALQTYAFPGRRNLGYLFAFESKRADVMASLDKSSRQVTLPPTRKRFEALVEYQRQFRQLTVWTCWTQLNSQYQLCMSYPSVLVGPSILLESSPDAVRVVRGSAAFRSEQRLPCLTWSSGTDGASLWRSSQPKVGLQGNRSTADEVYLKHIAESAMTTNALLGSAPPKPSRVLLQHLTGSPSLKEWTLESNCQLKILDLRPKSSAMANRTGGYGYENTSHYTGTTIQFCNIGNIHAIRDSYQKLSSLCMNPAASDVQWSQLVEETKWLSHLRLILAAAWEAAFWIHIYRLPVLVHCSHGWDRTSQVAVLAQLFLDPYYRTREGFSTLVEKDFMCFGHPFHTRCAHGEGRGERDTPSSTSSDEGQISPIFMQFLDCVYQIVHQYPECFEFNTKYLLVLSEHVYSCRFGTMLCDSERERELVAGIRQRTHSLWDYLDERDDLINSGYQEGGILLMPFPSLMRNVTLWVDRHCMYGPKATLRSLPTYLERPPRLLVTDQQGLLNSKDDFHKLTLDYEKKKWKADNEEATA